MVIVAALLTLGVAAQAANAAMGFPATADLNGRAGKSLTARVVKVDMYLQG
ncbi:hypothetical protein Misp02_58620 [Microtetraspora sp. NBRC 16547]|nr:hypothetical protein Misp02_58620 [Microtetraspora sp. NBRC 16547]